MLRPVLLCSVLLVFVIPGFAQLPGGNVFVGYSYSQTNLIPGSSTGLNGWNASVEGKVLPFIGLVADFSGNYGSESSSIAILCPVGLAPCPGVGTNIDIHEYNYLFGPRVSMHFGKIRPFVHALVGAGHIRASALGASTSDTSFADALGGGIDYHLIPLISWRVQLDALQTRFFGGNQNHPRFSTGIAIHF